MNDNVDCVEIFSLHELESQSLLKKRLFHELDELPVDFYVNNEYNDPINVYRNIKNNESDDENSSISFFETNSDIGSLVDECNIDNIDIETDDTLEGVKRKLTFCES
jgi:hypothetical protein